MPGNFGRMTFLIISEYIQLTPHMAFGSENPVFHFETRHPHFGNYAFNLLRSKSLAHPSAIL